jgi:hypothetical protein
VKTRHLIAACLLVLPGFVHANEDNSWCQGYVVKALGEFPVEGLSRVSLWLDWSAIVDETIAVGELDKSQYQAGSDHFSKLHSAGDTAGIIDVSEQRCALGRNPGWVWW